MSAAQGLQVTDLMGGISSAAANIMQGNADVANAQEKAATDRFNAQVALQTADSQMQGAAADVVDFRRQQMARVAASRAAAAGSGFLLEGSPLLVDKSAVTEIEFGANRIIAGARVNAARLRQQSLLLNRDATVETTNAKYARTASFIGAASGFVGGITNMAKDRAATIATGAGGTSFS